MENFQYTAEILIVGAGMAGLTAAFDLQQAGHNVLVIDKGRGLGGRLASRRIGQATFDHGAQFITTRTPRFSAIMDGMLKMGVVEEWYRNLPDGSEGHPRWRGKPAMTAVPKYLARDLNVLLGNKVVSLHHNPEGWVTTLEDEEKVFSGAVVLTPPVPQSLVLLDTSEVVLPSETRTRAESLQYECCLAVMAVLDGPTRIPSPGGLSLTDGHIAWIADNHMKGISTTPAVTLHATAAFSLERWDRDRNESGRELIRDSMPWLGSDVIEFQVHGWRYSKPIRVDESPCMILSQSPPLVLAGDAFGGQRVEGAALSGWAAAENLKRMNNKKKPSSP